MNVFPETIVFKPSVARTLPRPVDCSRLPMSEASAAAARNTAQELPDVSILKPSPLPPTVAPVADSTVTVAVCARPSPAIVTAPSVETSVKSFVTSTSSL